MKHCRNCGHEEPYCQCLGMPDYQEPNGSFTSTCSPVFSDTPETARFYESFADGLAIPNQDEWLAFCQRLERERDEARKDADKARAYKKVMKLANNDLRAWKDSAMKVLGEWEKTWEAAGSPGRLGELKAIALREFILENDHE